MSELQIKKVYWIGSSRRDMRKMLPAVRRTFGVALYAVQNGEMPPTAKPLKGFGGADVQELVEDDRAGTYRAVYTVRFAMELYVLHVFQKKSKHGRATTKQDIDLIKERLKRAAELHHRNRES